MVLNEVKTSIQGLEIGMYVSRLDRPWLETPYLMEAACVENIETDPKWADIKAAALPHGMRSC